MVTTHPIKCPANTLPLSILLPLVHPPGFGVCLKTFKKDFGYLHFNILRYLKICQTLKFFMVLDLLHKKRNPLELVVNHR